MSYLTEVLELFDSMRTVPYLQGFSSVPGCLLMAGHTNPEVLAYLVHLFSATDLNLLFADQVTNMNTFIQMILGLYKLRNTTCVASRDPDFATRTELTLLEWISTCFTVYLGLFESLGFLAYLAQYGSIALVCMSLSVMEYCLVDERLRNSAELMYAEQRTPFQPKLSPWQKRIKEVSIVQKALQLERDVVVSTRFKEWKRNAVVPNKNRGPTQNMNHAEEAVKTFPPVPNARYMNPAVIEHFVPNSSTHQFSSPLQPITAVNTHHFQSPNFVQTHSSNLSAEQNSQPNAQLVSLQGPQAERKPTRSPRMSGTWKEPFSVSNGVPATPIKAFLVPQTQPILLRRSEPQPQLTRFDSTPQNSRFWMDKPGPTNDKTTSQVNLRNNVTITLPQATSMGVNMSNPWQNTLQGSQVAHETKSKNLLSLPANMVQNLGSNSQGTGQSIRHLKESYRPLLSSTYGPPGRQDPFRSAVAAHHPQQPVQQYQPVAVQQPNATVSAYSQPRADHGQQFSHFANNQVAQSPLRSFHGYSQSENIEAQPSVMVQPQRQQVETRAGSHNVRESRSAEPFHRMPENYWSQTQNNQRVASPSPGSRRNPLLSMPRF